MFRLSVWLSAAVVAAGPAFAQNGGPQSPALPAASEAAKSVSPAPPGPPARRYRFSHFDDGVLRLDNETGQVMICKSQAGTWVCKEVPERSASFDAEIARLKEQNLVLESQIEASEKLAAKTQERDALHEKIATLQSENAALRAQVDALKNQVAALEGLMGAQTERDSLKAEISGLKSANDRMKDELAAVQAQTAILQQQLAQLAPPRPPEDVPPTKSGDLKKPLREDIERARAVMEDAWRRVVEMLINLQRDMMGRG